MNATVSTGPVAPRRPPRRGAKGGRKRMLSLRLLPEEHALLRSRACGAGLSVGAYLRASALGEAGPRARPAPAVDADLLARAVAALNKVGSNLNQIARALNRDRLTGSSPQEPPSTNAVIAEVKRAVGQIRAAVGRRRAVEVSTAGGAADGELSRDQLSDDRASAPVASINR